MRGQWLAALGLDSRADTDAVKEAFRGCAKKFHPDVNSSPEAAERFRQATEAYEHLIENGALDTQQQGTFSSHGPAMEARWNIRRRHTPSEYPAWFKPPADDPPGGSRSVHSSAGFRRAASVAAGVALATVVHRPSRAALMSRRVAPGK